MYIERVPNRNSPPAVLLRESYREGGRVRKRTLANLSHLPDSQIEALRHVLRGGSVSARLDDAFEITRSLPHGHVAAVLGSVRRLGLARIISPHSAPQRDRVIALIAARILDPRSKLATAQGLDPETAFSSLGEELGLRGVSADELYEAMDWLLPKQEAIERRLAKKHLSDGSLILYDLTSTYFEGRSCPLAKRGYSRDKIKGKLQINIGLLCDERGCPIAVEVFSGNSADPSTVSAQVDKVRSRFGLKEVIFVGDRGMLTAARIREDLQPHKGFDWITSLRAPAIKRLVHDGRLQPSLFDERDLAEITAPEFPGERLVVCRNPLLAQERTRKREDLLKATEKELDKIVQGTQRPKRRLHGKDKIGLRVGRVLGRFKMAKHFHIEIGEDSFQYRRDDSKIAEEAALDGIYVVRTSVPSGRMGTDEVVSAYKDLSTVERAFRSLKTIDLKIRPIHHRLEERVRAHVLFCMLAYYVEWHMRRARRTDDNLPVHSFQNLLKDLATITKNQIQPKLPDAKPFIQLTAPNPLQQRALDLLHVSLQP